MASVESIERELRGVPLIESALLVQCDASAAEDAPPDHEITEVACLFTGGINSPQSAPSDAEIEDATETERTEQPPGHVGHARAKPNMAQAEPEDAEVDIAGDRSRSPIDESHSFDPWDEYISDNPLTSACMPTPPETLEGDLADPAEVQDIAMVAALGALIGTNAYEKWDVDRDAAAFLASVLALGKDDGASLQLHDSYISFNDLKLMEPLLHMDPELDMQRLKRRNRVKISAEGIEEIPLDTDKDEGVEWPQRLLDLPLQKQREIASEKLEVGKEVMEYLHGIAEPELLSCTDMMDTFINSDKVRRFHWHGSSHV